MQDRKMTDQRNIKETAAISLRQLRDKALPDTSVCLFICKHRCGIA